MSRLQAPSRSRRLSQSVATPFPDPPGLGGFKQQQRLLDLFSDAFASVLNSDRFAASLQDLKQALYRRDFAAAFANEHLLEIYAARWSPSRALCYASVLLANRHHLDQVPILHHDVPTPTDSESQLDNSSSSWNAEPLRVLSIGGGAAELTALASYLHETSSRGCLTLLDSASWSHVVSRIQEQLLSPPRLSKYASATAKASNKALLDSSQLSLNFRQQDVFSISRNELLEVVGQLPLVVTLLFTLNELYTDGGVGKTTSFLRLLGDVLPHGSLLLVVDSPGSYSEAAIGKEKRRYPMQWLLHHTLLQLQAAEYRWERLDSSDSIWFRLPEGLSYPIPLENMRYQFHLYRIQRETH